MHPGYLLALVLVILGFIALIMQRVYIKDEKGSVSEINLPVLGKMKTNFPALLFVFLGVATFVYITESEIRNPNAWKFEGDLVFDEDIRHLRGNIDLSKGRVQIMPRFENSMIDREGVFTLFVNTPAVTDPKEYIRLLRYKVRVSDTCVLSAEVTGADLIRNNGQSRSFTVRPTLRAQDNAICS